MSESKMNDVPKMDVPPALLAMGERLGNELILCGEKAVAHVAEPQGYPVAAGSLEQSLAARLGRIPAERQALAVQRVMPALKASSPERASRLGELAAVDLRSPEAVSAQVSRVAAPKLAQLSREQLAAMAPVRHRGLEDVADRGGGDGTVQVRVRRVRCVVTTDDGIGTDEMALGGMLIDAAGNSTKITQFELPGSVGNRDGDWAIFSPPRVLGTMTSPMSVSYPQTFTALYIFAELDNGGFPDFLSKALDWARPKAAEELGKLAAQGLEQYLGPVLAKAIGQVVAWLVDFALGKLIGWIKSVWEDDIFPPITDIRTIQGPVNWQSAELMGWAKAHGGHYEIYVDWIAEFSLDSYFHIIAKHSGKCLNVAGGGTENGAQLIQWPVTDWADNDKWRLEPAGEGYFHIIAKHSGKCLNVAGGGTENGAQLIQWPVTDWADNDKWRLEPAGEGYFHIIAKHSGKCLNVAGGGTENGAQIIQWPVSDSDNDKWRLEPA